MSPTIVRIVWATIILTLDVLLVLIAWRLWLDAQARRCIRQGHRWKTLKSGEQICRRCRRPFHLDWFRNRAGDN